MAKKSMIHRDKIRSGLSKKFKNLRDQYRAASKQGDDEAAEKLNALPVDSSPCRSRRRCRHCGRPRATLRRFGVCRICLRQLVMSGMIPGVKKSSW